ncbi:MAG: hypothetical protein ACYCZF_09585 [Anaerolineae bacterium]
MRRRGFLALTLAVLANGCSVSLLPSTNARRMATPETTEVTQPSVTPQMPTSTAMPSPTLTETPKPTATSTRTLEPTLTPTYTPDPILQAPEIEGLVGRMDGDILKYYAEAGNKYGLEADAYAGEFRPNVLISGERTGGLVLTASVAETILREELAKIENPDDRWLIPLPVDIRDLNKDSEVKIGFEKGNSKSGANIGSVNFEGTASVINILPNTLKINVAKISQGWVYYDQMRLVAPYTDNIYKGKEMSYISVAGAFNISEPVNNYPSVFGEKLFGVEGKTMFALSSGQEARSVDASKILTLNGMPVFVAGNN